ncbi:MAG: hypothetical protein LBK71_03330 [Verrucomicrobiales bacterium]|jgi:hypothetical protein|nr:hypothetical protein [Verrucomicrobiales bacterium]
MPSLPAAPILNLPEGRTVQFAPAIHTPGPAFLNLSETIVREIANGIPLPFSIVWDMARLEIKMVSGVHFMRQRFSLQEGNFYIFIMRGCQWTGAVNTLPLLRSMGDTIIKIQPDELPWSHVWRHLLRLAFGGNRKGGSFGFFRHARCRG